MNSRETIMAKIAPDDVQRRIRAAIAPSEAKVALHEPRFLGNEKLYVTECIETGWVSYAGAFVQKFETALAEACGAPHVVCVSSGTVALQIALQAAGVEPGDEVLVPSLTFVATPNAVSHLGAIPHFVDSDEETLGVSPTALAAHLDRIGEARDGKLYNRQTGRRLAALLPVHVFGHPADMDALNALMAHHGIAVVEDATESLGSRYKDQPCGALAPLATLSFNGNKIVTTGGGGAIVTQDAKIAHWIRHMTTTAKQPHPWRFDHDAIAWNFRLPNLNAALGLAQLERLPQMLAAKRRLHQRYAEAFAGLAGARLFTDASFARSNYWLCALILDRGQEAALEPILEATNASGLATRPAWTPMHQLPIYAGHPRADVSTAENLSRRILSLPSSPFLAPP
jgi:perosamine synthetase